MRRPDDDQLLSVLDSTAAFLHKQGVGEGSTAVDHARKLIVELRSLEAICARLIAAYDHEESEDGFPFSFELRDAHRALCRHMEAR